MNDLHPGEVIPGIDSVDFQTLSRRSAGPELLSDEIIISQKKVT
jgi:hypothetical protein